MKKQMYYFETYGGKPICTTEAENMKIAVKNVADAIRLTERAVRGTFLIFRLPLHNKVYWISEKHGDE